MYRNKQVYMYHYVFSTYVYDINDVFFTTCGSEAVYEKKQSIMTHENENAKLQAQVEELKTTSAKKDTLIAKYEAIVKEGEGEDIG